MVREIKGKMHCAYVICLSTNNIFLTIFCYVSLIHQEKMSDPQAQKILKKEAANR